MKLIKKIFWEYADKYKITNLIQQKADRVVLYNTVSTVSSFFVGLFKFVVGLILFSMWFALFGVYYLVLFGIRIFFLHKYYRMRTDKRLPNQKYLLENHYLKLGGMLYTFLGITFTGVSVYMVQHETVNNYNMNLVLLLALTGFIKIITSIVGWIKARNFKSPIISFLKTLNIADGLMSIALTQYAILSMEHEKSASVSTGRFGIGIGIVLMLIGIFITIKSARNKFEQLM